MLHFISYILIALCLIYGIGFLTVKKYRGREMIWLPLSAIGFAIVLAAYTFNWPLQSYIAILGFGLSLTGIAVSRKPRQKQNGTTGA